MSKIKSCINCGNPFFGRRDAKTCSARCRKALQRNRATAQSAHRAKPTEAGHQSIRAKTLPAGTSQASRSPLARRYGKRLITLALAVCVAVVSLSGSVSAGVSQGYVSNDTELRQFMAVKLAGDDAQGHPVVQTSSLADQDKTIGIAVGMSDSLLTVAPVSSEVYIVSSGPTKAYISDINGSVAKGDLLAVSPLRGILMKSTDPTKPTVGQAIDDFIGQKTETIIARDNKGKPVDVHVAIMQMDVSIKPPKMVGSPEENNWLKSLGNSLVGHEISSLRIIAALAVFFTLMVIEGELIYGTIASTITAIGRNPLAKGSIMKQSVHSARIAVFILILGIVSVGLLLWL